MAASAHYPVRVEAALDPPLSRWLWLVKWLLVVPHYVLLFFLWIAFAVLSVVAFFAILVTGRYPRGIFEFNVGVLRWSWRVAYYAYGALGTDRYPPFTLADVPDYPAHLEVEYPHHLSRGLVLVKWWLLALPHYLVVGFFLGGGTWLLAQGDEPEWMFGSSGLIGLLVLVAAVVLLFTGSYPRPIYDFVLGMNRWVLRVAAYAGLMTDDYPPFRLDMGEHEPDAGGAMTLAPSVAGAGAPTTQSTPTSSTPTPPSPTSTPGPRHFGPGRVLALVVGAMMALAAVPVLVGGGAVLWADRTQRDDAGFLTSPASDVSTTTYALTSRADSFTIDADTPDWVLGDVVGDVRVRVTPTDATPVFVGIARSGDVERYLAGTSYATIDSLDDGVSTAVPSPGIGAPASPDEQPFWVAKATGPGTQTLQWPMREGDWRIVVMKPDGAAGVAVRADIAAEAPVLPWVAAGLLIAGVLLLAAGTTLIVVASVARTKRTP